MTHAGWPRKNAPASAGRRWDIPDNRDMSGRKRGAVSETIRAQRVLDELRALAAVVATSASPYETAPKIHIGAMGGIPGSDLDERQRQLNDQLHALWLIWGALTDWVENKPGEAGQAESEMRRAAAEWLAVPDDDEALWRPFFDRWVYEELGYARPGPSGAS